ncbi:type II toxin-antitoxin system VapC family toxin [Ornithinimicrobium ciconiae]|uniref:Ribonuclease VapC n=1 Tax=Ornithinimicrobium ciconiae TaxID=2594265 RepID=A0A516GDH8_9MICO|nr:type II toxin-antitoxin system VapC family toxin [Ornithinimicrobium ciconiae]QDO89578.1 type II toxin-antitoxin system VapC family toxin [Ornithinimicrobium ciconiae]
MSSEPQVVLDTSAAVPLLVSSHEAHAMVSSWAVGRVLGLSGHALAETYAVLTRLPGDSRVSPADAVRLIDDNFQYRLVLDSEVAGDAHRELARCGVSGGATYDGLVALTARAHDAVLVTRDARARPTYEAVGAQVQVLVDTR